MRSPTSSRTSTSGERDPAVALAASARAELMGLLADPREAAGALAGFGSASVTGAASAFVDVRAAGDWRGAPSVGLTESTPASRGAGLDVCEAELEVFGLVVPHSRRMSAICTRSLRDE